MVFFFFFPEQSTDHHHSDSPNRRSVAKMKSMILAVALMGLVLGANAGAVDLTAKNFDKEVFESGKSAFVKFLAPW